MTEIKTPRPLDVILSKREQQVMEVIHRQGEVTAGELFDELPDAASYNAVRGVLRGLEAKGRLEHRREGRSFVYRPTVPAERAGRNALRQVAETFFSGSTERLLNTLLEAESPSAAELDRLGRLIEAARQQAMEEGGGEEGER